MSSTTIQNIVIGVLALILLGLGYYLFVQPNSFNLETGSNSQVNAQVLARTQDFIARREQLSTVTIDEETFSNPRFTGLRSYTPPLTEQSLGKRSIFDLPASLKETSEGE